MPEYTGPMATMGESSLTVEKPEFTGGVNAVWGSSPWTSSKGGVNAVPSSLNGNFEYRGGASFVLAASNDLPEYKVVSMVLRQQFADFQSMERNKPVLAAANDKLSLGQMWWPIRNQQLETNRSANTGSKETSSLISLGLAGVILSLLHLARRKE